MRRPCGLYYGARVYADHAYSGQNGYVLACGNAEYVLFGTYLSAPGTFGQGYGYIYYAHRGESRPPEEVLASGIYDVKRRRF